jgi:hypothetical protein
MIGVAPLRHLSAKLLSDRISSALLSTCPSRKSYPRVAMMQSGQDWYGDDGPRLLDGPS